MKGLSTPLLLVAVLALSTSGCSDQGREITGPGDGSGIDPVSFAQQVQPIFDLNCVGCHGDGGNGGLDLRPEASYANLVGIDSQTSAGTRVQPGNAAGSDLYRRLTGDGLDFMPPGGGLDQSSLDLVERWIDEGAADN